eukprot:10003097-Ditylum_brightwellii.AAC.1
MNQPLNADGIQPDNEHESQFIWDNDTQEPIKDMEDESSPENEDKEGGTRNVEENNTPAMKQSKKAVELNTQGDASPTSAQEKTRNRGDTALDAEAGYQTDIRIEWLLNKGCDMFNI